MTDIGDILRSAPLIDGHNDLLWEMRGSRQEQGTEPDVAGPVDHPQTDLPRLAEGCVGGQFWSVYVPSDLPPDQAVIQTLEQIDSLFALVRAHPDRLELARTADDVERIAAAGKVASMIGVEGGHSIGSSLGALRIMAELGAGYMTLTHNDDTPWADSATGDHLHGGLTRFGEDVVRELNRCGVLVDLSHTSDDTMRQAIEISAAPPFFSHSSARALCDVPRNVPDDVLELVGRTGGVVMVTFVPWFLTPEGARANQAVWEQTRRLRAQHPGDPDAVRAEMAHGRRSNRSRRRPSPTSRTTSTTSATWRASRRSGSARTSTASRRRPRVSRTCRVTRRCLPSSRHAAMRTTTCARSPGATCSA
jgi:membrane dipeptidase